MKYTQLSRSYTKNTKREKFNENFLLRMAAGMMITKTNRNVSGWSLENGYMDEIDDHEYPIRVTETGTHGALDIAMTISKLNFDRVCRGFDEGFRVILSVPGEDFKLSPNFLRVPASQNSLIKIKPKLIRTSESIRHYEPNQRQCFYNSERKLRFYKIYSQSNCEMECLANFTKMECGCVRFSVPRTNISSFF